MSARDPRDEDGGYGAGNLVGSDSSGVDSAIEARRAVEASRERAAGGGAMSQENTDLGRLADGGPRGTRGIEPDATVGAASLGDRTGGTRAAAGRRDADRDSRDHGNSRQD
jgi:hypothetical protein